MPTKIKAVKVPPTLHHIGFSMSGGSTGWGGTLFDPDLSSFPFAWPDKEKYLAIFERKYQIKPGQVIVCRREGDFLQFNRRELVGVYYYYTPLETVYSPVKKLLW